jgi:transposase
MAGKRRKHSEDFKRDAVALSYNSEKSMAEIAGDLGIHRSVLVRWRKECEELGEKAFPGNGLRKLSPLEEENLWLKKQLADVTEERDILKKAVHIFSKKPK